MSHYYIIGAGGVGSWLLPSVCMLVGHKNVTVFDGDTLETKNLNRQLFTLDDIGSNKAEALAKKYQCQSVPQYFAYGKLDNLRRWDVLLVAADNNAARHAAWMECNEKGCPMIVGANEVTSAEAYYYERSLKETDRDPAVYYPELTTDTSDDPRHAAIGCTGEVQRTNRQLVSANFMAASLMQHLLVLWNIERSKVDKEGLAHFPVRIRQNLTKYEVLKLKG